MPTTEMNPAGAVPEEPVRPMVASKVHAATSWSKSTVYSPAEAMAVVELFTPDPRTTLPLEAMTAHRPALQRTVRWNGWLVKTPVTL